MAALRLGLLPRSWASPGQPVASPPGRPLVACYAKKKEARHVITLECTEARPLGLTPSRYTTEKNRRNSPDRLELMKYNRFLRRRTLHKEIK